MGSRAWGRNVLVGAFAVALLATACGSGTSRQRADGFEIATVSESTQAAGSARYQSTFRSTFPKGSDGVEIRVEGEVDFAGHRASSEQRGRKPNGEWSEPQTNIRIGDDVWFETRDPPPDRVSGSDGMGLDKPWTHYSMAGFGTGTLDDFRLQDVSRLLADLGAEGRAEEIGTELVRGDETTHYRFTGEDLDLPAQMLAGGMMTGAGATVDVWVDGEQRLRRMDREYHDGSETSSTEFFDFGAPVQVEAPPASEVRDEPFASSGITGDWAEVQAGRTDGVSWTVFHAPAPHRSECLSVESEPGDRLPGGRTERGRRVSFCSPQMFGSVPDDAEQWEGDEVQTTTVALRGGQAILVGMTGPKVSELVLHHRDGRTERVRPVARTFLVVLGHEDVVDRIDPVIPDADVTCELDDSYGEFNCSGSYGPQTPPRAPCRRTGPTICPRRMVSHRRDIIAGCPSASVETVTIWS